MIRHAAFAIAMTLAAAGTALPETLDEPTPPTQAWHALNSDELWKFVHEETRYDLVDLETGQQGIDSPGRGTDIGLLVFSRSG